MVMALGIFLMYPGRYLAESLMDHELARWTLLILTLAICAFGAYVIFRFAAQAVIDRTVLWNHTLDHIRIGTWVAGLNVLAVLFHGLIPLVAQVLHGLAWAVWIGYMIWLVQMTWKKQFVGGGLTGSLFLTTVATQSLIAGFVRVLPDHVSEWIYLLISMNVFGIILYWISFALVWIAGGFVGPVERWIPQNNITHGALSISMLAAQMIEERIPGTLPYFHYVIQLAWVTTTIFLVLALVYETTAVLRRTTDLLTFRMTNYARNFTWGMYFACTYYGYTYAPPSLMKGLLNPAMLTLLAVLVLTMNAWELGRQFVLAVSKQPDLRTS